MTTIAWDGRVLAVDSQESCGGSVSRYKNKLIELPDGGWAAAAGDIKDIATLEQWLKGNIDRPEDELNINCILWANNKLWEIPENLVPIEIENPRKTKITAGHGWKWAQAALDFGYNAIQAVEYAGKKDIYTGGDVNYVEIFSPQKGKK